MINSKYDVYQPKFEEIMSGYASLWDKNLECVSVIKCKIDLTNRDTRPIYSSPYRAGPCQRQPEREEVNKMLQDEVSENDTTEWISPVVFTPKKDGSLWICVDCRRLNAMAVRDSYPIPRMEECTD